MKMTLEEVVDIYEKIKNFSDEEIEMYIQVAIQKDPTVDADSLRLSLKKFQDTSDVN